MTSKPRRSSRSTPNTPNANLEASLGKWYDDNQVVRRAWATQDAQRVRVYVLIEPTPDGNDPLPLWLANCRTWRNELQSSIRQPIHLQSTSDVPEIGGDEVVIADFSWRDPWPSPPKRA
jgi:hypothetical protein